MMAPFKVKTYRLYTFPFVLAGILVLVSSCRSSDDSQSERWRIWRSQIESGDADVPTLVEVQSLLLPERRSPPPSWSTHNESDLGKRSLRDRFEHLQVRSSRAESSFDELEGFLADDLDHSLRRDVLVHMCILAEAKRDYRAVRNYCAGFLNIAQGDHRSLGVLALLQKSRNAMSSLDDLILAEAEKWKSQCREFIKIENRSSTEATPRCAEFAFLLEDWRLKTASQQKLKEKAFQSAAGRGALSGFRVEGPYELENSQNVTEVGETTKPSKIERNFTSRVAAPWHGTIFPAKRGARGIYRLSLDGFVEQGNHFLFMRTNASVLFSIDGQSVLKQNLVREEGLDTHVLPLRFSKGHHQIEIWVEANVSSYLELSLLKEDGLPSWRHDETKATPGRIALLRREKTPEVLGVAHPSDIDEMLLKHAVLQTGLMSSSTLRRTHYERMWTLAGFAPQVMVAVGSAIQRDGVGNRTTRDALVRRVWDALPLEWKNHPVPKLFHARTNVSDHPKRALQHFHQLVQLHPDYPFGLRELAELSYDEGLLDDAYTYAAKAISLDPSSSNLRTYLRVHTENELVSSYLERQKQYAAMDNSLFGAGLAMFFMEQRLYDSAVEELVRICDAEDGHEAEEMLWSLLEINQPAIAYKRMKNILEMFPNDVGTWLKILKLLNAHPTLEDWDSVFLKVQDNFPSERSLFDLEEELRGYERQQQYEARTTDVLERFRQIQQTPFEGHPAVFLINEIERHFFLNGSGREYRYQLLELRTKEALDRFGELRLAAGEVLKTLRVFKKNGERLEPEFHDQIEDVSLVGLEIGDIIEYVSFQTFDHFGEHGFTFDTCALTSAVPSLKRTCIFSIPNQMSQDATFQLIRRNEAPMPTVQESRGRTVYRFLQENSYSGIVEPFAPSALEREMLVGFSYRFDLEDWARIRSRELAGYTRPDPWFVRAADLIAGQGPAERRFVRLFSFVLNEIKFTGMPREALATLSEGQGNRLNLLMALSQANGLPVEAVALQPLLTAPVDIPSVNLFSVVGLRLNAPDKREGDIYAFPHLAFGELNALHPAAKGAQLLSLNAPMGNEKYEESSSIPSYAVSDQAVRYETSLTLNTNHELEGNFKIVVPAYLAESLRGKLLELTEMQIVQVLEHSMGTNFRGTQISEAQIHQLDVYGSPMVIEFDYKVPLEHYSDDFVEIDNLFPQGAGVGFGLMVPFTAYLQVLTRNTSLLVQPAREELQFVIKLPKDAAFIKVPESYKKVSGPFLVEQTAEVTDGVLKWDRHINVALARVSPSDWEAVHPQLTALLPYVRGTVSFVLP